MAKEKFVMANNSKTDAQQGAVKIVRGRVDSLSLYEITDSELKTLERGSPSSIYLNFAIFLLSAGCSFLISLVTAKIEAIKIYVTFIVFTIIGILGGLILLCLWWRERGTTKEVVKAIYKRIPSSEIVKVDRE